MNRFFSADCILSAAQPAVVGGIVETDRHGIIIQVHPNLDSIERGTEIEYHQGIITPGFVNAHCHLELSHLHNQIPRQTGLVPFIQNIMKNRNHQEEKISKSMNMADQEMFKRGIVAVGDHVNTTQSIKTKVNSPIQYHTFVELLGMKNEDAESLYEDAVQKREEFRSAGLSAENSPHSAYSVSRLLFRTFKKHENLHDVPLSMHNQESDEENKLYKNLSGDFIKFYQTIGAELQTHYPYNSTALGKSGQWLPIKRRIQLVHNTFTRYKDISLMIRRGFDVYWCFCPNANIYIENTLPNLDYFTNKDLNITLGTDSLASNDQLCILSELKTLHQYFPNLDLEDTIQWATINGAKFLGLESRLGSIEVGKKPGLVLIENTKDGKLTAASISKRLI